MQVISSASTSAVVGATAAVAATPSFHADNPVFEELYSRLFNSTLGYQAVFQLGGSTGKTLYPTGSQKDSDQVEFTVGSAVNMNDYSFQWLANYAAVHLTGFRREDVTYSSVDLYPSASSVTRQNLSKVGSPVYAKLVLFSDVNTSVTPVYDYYSEGEYLYQLLWGTKWE